MIQIVKKQVRDIWNLYSQRDNRLEFERQEFSKFNERPVEYGFVFSKLSQIYPRKVLDIGTGVTSLPRLLRQCGFLVTAIDNVRDYWTSGMINSHYHIIDDDITDTQLTEKFDFITCISVLEHIEKSGSAVRNMFNLLTPRGHLVLTFPYTENNYIENVYHQDGSTHGHYTSVICQSYSREKLNQWLQDNNGTLIDQEYWQFFPKYWTVGEQIIPPKMVTVDDNHQLSCILIQKNQ